VGCNVDNLKAETPLVHANARDSSDFLASAVTIRPARSSDIDSIVALHREAFADKFGSAFGADGAERGSAALAAAWRHHAGRALRGMYVADSQQQVIGTTTLRTWETSEESAAAMELAFQQALGVWGATRSIFVLSLLSHRIDQHEGFITDVAVLPGFRRSGTASRLLNHAEREARRLNRQFLGLYVSSANRAAIELYLKAGFYKARVRRSWLTRLFFGQREWLYMRKDLSSGTKGTKIPQVS
jgi:ribosomal protein S18 acetylase RimI-like enzyme